jgi:hypothetical protein
MAQELSLGPSNVWIAPDPISSADMLYSGTLLYFDAPVVLTIPPQVITPESFELFERLKHEKPAWALELVGIVSAWRKKKEDTENILKILEPLSKNAFYTVWLVYNSNDEAMAKARDLISTSGWTPDRLLSSIDFDNACGELVRHIFLEKYLEFGRNLDDLNNYAREMLTRGNLSEILSSAYALRLLAITGQIKGGHISVALTNPHLANFLADLPKVDTKSDSDDETFDIDAVSMMVFNGLLSNWIDPLSTKNVEVLAKLRETKRGEIDRLKGKCLSIADGIDRKSKPERLAADVDRKIRFSILPEVRDLLELGDDAFRTYKESLFSDQIFWTSFLTTIVSAITETELVSAGAAISTLANMGAKAFSQYREVRQTVKKSDYSLIYTVSKMQK